MVDAAHVVAAAQVISINIGAVAYVLAAPSAPASASGLIFGHGFEGQWPGSPRPRG